VTIALAEVHEKSLLFGEVELMETICFMTDSLILFGSLLFGEVELMETIHGRVRGLSLGLGRFSSEKWN